MGQLTKRSPRQQLRRRGRPRRTDAERREQKRHQLPPRRAGLNAYGREPRLTVSKVSRNAKILLGLVAGVTALAIIDKLTTKAAFEEIPPGSPAPRGTAGAARLPSLSSYNTGLLGVNKGAGILGSVLKQRIVSVSQAGVTTQAGSSSGPTTSPSRQASASRSGRWGSSRPTGRRGPDRWWPRSTATASGLVQ